MTSSSPHLQQNQHQPGPPGAPPVLSAASPAQRSADESAGRTTRVEPDEDGDPVSVALERMQASRGKLIVALSPDPPATRRAAAPTSPESTDPTRKASVAAAVHAPSAGDASSSFARLIDQWGLPEGTWRTLTESTQSWWRRQPWHEPVELVGSTVLHHTKPLVRRNPWTSLAVAASVGAAMAAARPWAWKPLQQRVAPLRQDTLGFVWSQLSQPAVQLAVAGAVAAWLSERGKTQRPGLRG